MILPEILFNSGEDYKLRIDIHSMARNFWFISTSWRAPLAASSSSLPGAADPELAQKHKSANVS
jgi:hypothetical protein